MSIFKKAKKENKNLAKADIPNASATRQRVSTLMIRQPWITEKATDLGGFRKYIFVVDRKANKSEIKKAIESIYSVKVKDINIINIKGKAKRLGRSLGKTSSIKKAIATLRKGEKIDIMPT